MPFHFRGDVFATEGSRTCRLDRLSPFASILTVSQVSRCAFPSCPSSPWCRSSFLCDPSILGACRVNCLVADPAPPEGIGQHRASVTHRSSSSVFHDHACRSVLDTSPGCNCGIVLWQVTGQLSAAPLLEVFPGSLVQGSPMVQHLRKKLTRRSPGCLAIVQIQLLLGSHGL